MIVVGLTGGLGAGKTTVLEYFAQCGAVVIDTDGIVHELLAGGRCCHAVGKAFPEAVIGGRIDRKALGRIVFDQPRKLKLLEKILHPAVRRDVEQRIRSLLLKRSKPRMVVVDVPLLFEAKFDDLCDVTVVVRANQALQIKRLVKKRGMTIREILIRIRQQMPQGEKMKKADFIVDNRYTKAKTRAQIKKIWDGLVTE